MIPEEIEGLESLKLTEEELNKFEYFRQLSAERKEELISFIYEIGLILYCTNMSLDE